MEIIQLSGVNHKRGSCQILKDINLSIYNGEFLTLLGPSGCGKTTLLRLIAGLDNPDTGSIIINSYNVTNLPPEQRQVNMIFQNYALFPHLNVYDNVAFGLRVKKTPENVIRKKVTDILNTVKLSHLAHRYPHSLSGGQQQRVAIARAVVNEPLVLLLDEPLSALDYKLRKVMQIELKQLQRRLGITFIFVTHDQEEALSMSDRVAVMNDGVIEQIGTPKDVYEEPNSLYVAKFIGEVNIFNGEIKQNEGDYLVTEIEGRLYTLKNRKKLSSGSKISVIIRPEDIDVWGDNEVLDEEKGGMFSGIVEQVIYKGSTVDLIVKLMGGQRVLATEFFNEDDEKLDYHVGEKVWLSWVSGWEVILPYE